MKLSRRLYLSLVLTPVFWLIFIAIYFVAQQSVSISTPIVLGYTLVMSYTCAYIVVMFCLAWRNEFLGKSPK
jgi:hypothetical protein